MTARDHTPSAWQRRLLLWGGLLLGATLLCCALIIVLAPKVINRDAFRSRIETAISGTLGGTVIYDRLDLVLFPQPELKFSNLKIDIPRTGSISIDTVDIYAKLIPLLLGRFDISSVTLDRPALRFHLPGAAAKSGRPSSRKSGPSGRSAGDILTVAASAMPDLSLKVIRGMLSLKREDQPVLLLKDVESVLSFVPGQGEVTGRSGNSSADTYRITGKAQCTISDIAALPGPLLLSIKQFDVLPGQLTVTKGRARLLDTDASFSGSFEDHLSSELRSDIAMSGSFGEETAAWLRTLAGLPADVVLRTPVKVTAARLRTAGTGSTRSRSVTLAAQPKDGPSVTLALLWEPARFSLEKLQVQDEESDATFTLRPDADDRVLSFSGILTGSTAGRVVGQDRLSFGWIKGNARVRMPGSTAGRISANGGLEGERISMPSLLHGAFVVSRFSVSAEDRTLHLQPVVLALGTDTLTMQGDASFSDSGLTLDLDVDAKQIGFEALRELMKQEERKEEDAAPSSRKKLSIDGELRLRAAAVDFERYTVSDLAMSLSFGERIITVTVPSASICGIGLNGTMRIEDNSVDLDFRTKVRGGTLEKSIPCVLRQEPGLSGPFDLSGSFTGSGAWDELLPSLEGSFELITTRGRITSSRIVKGVIAYLNSTSMFKDSRTDLLESGFPYDTIAFRGSLQEGVVRFSEASIRSRDIHLTADGDVDLRNGTLALNVLAAPFTSLDRLLGKIPVVKYLAGNALIVVPARVEGTFSEPKVIPLALSGVGTNITNLMKNIVQAPVKVIEPTAPQERK